METPDFFGGGYFNATSANSFSPEKRIAADQKLGENFNFTIEDLLDFSNDDVIISDGVLLDNVTGNSTDSSTVTCNSAASGGDNNCAGNFGGNSFADSQFSGELCVPVNFSFFNSVYEKFKFHVKFSNLLFKSLKCRMWKKN